MSTQPEAGRAPGGQPFLPDFCQTENLLRTVIIAQLLAFVLTAARPVGGLQDRLVDLGMLSLAIQWIALADVALLCALRDRLARLDDRAAAGIAFLLLQLVTVGFTLGMHWLGAAFGFSFGPEPLATKLASWLVISIIVSAVGLRYFYVSAEWKRNVSAEAEARVDALQARIRPHFLFNSMNTIASLTRSDPAAAEAAVEDLAELFRGSLGNRTNLSLHQEFELIASYLRIEQQRLGERLQVDWELDHRCDDVRIPALTLQPLVENAVYHGVEQIGAGGLVRIASRHEGDHVVIRIENPLPSTSRDGGGNRMALDNVRQRLALAFGSDAHLSMTSADDCYRVEVTIPVEPDA